MLYRWRTVCVFRIRLAVAGEDVMRTGHATRPAFAACQKLPHKRRWTMFISAVLLTMTAAS